MKEVRRIVHKTIKTETPEEFDRQLNEILSTEQEPEYTIHQTVPFLAYCTYVYYEYEPESIQDEYELRGMKFTCDDCPYIDKTGALWNQKKFPCRKLNRNTYVDSRACTWYYEEYDRKGAVAIENDTEG